MKSKKESRAVAKDFRRTLQALIRRELPDMESRTLAEQHTGIPERSIQTMMYQGQGGMDSWITLLAYCFKLRPNQLDSLFGEIKEFLRRQRKLKPEEIRWQETGENLSRDRKLFWCDAIKALEDIERTYRNRKES